MVGIDVGTHSLGTAAIDVDDRGTPIRILSAVTLIHDSGIDPDGNKKAVTRQATAGLARRTRRLFRRRTKRTARLERFLADQGWATNPFSDYSDPYLPWKVRAELASGYIADDAERGEKLSIAIRHIANHRGWRNPYSRIHTLYSPGEPSDAFHEIREGLEEKYGCSIPADVTVAQLISVARFGEDRLLGGGKDNAAMIQGEPWGSVHPVMFSETPEEITSAPKK